MTLKAIIFQTENRTW